MSRDKIKWPVSYLGDTIGFIFAFYSVIIRIRKGCCMFRDLAPLVASSGLPLLAKGTLYSACLCCVIIYGSETYPVKEEDVIRPERDDPKMVRWMCNVRPEDRISGYEHFPDIRGLGENLEVYEGSFLGAEIFCGGLCLSEKT